MTSNAPSWSSTTPVARPRLLGFALGKVGSGIYATVPGLLLMFYLTDTLAISAAVAGLVVVVPKVWDIFCAAFVGAWSDREAVRHGRRTRLMLMGTVLLPVLFVLLFSGPGSGWAAVLWVVVIYVLAATAFELFDIPYLAMPSEMSASPRQRTRIMGWRIIATTLGVLVAGALAPMAVSSAGGGRRGYVVMAALMAAIIFAVLLVCTLSSRWVDARSHEGEHPGWRDAFRIARQNRSFVLLLASYLPHAAAISIIQASMAYVAAHLLGDAGLMSLLFIALMGPSILAVPAWTRISHRLGKSRTFATATGLYALCALVMFPAVLSGNTTLVLGVAVVLGIAFAGEQVMVYAMLPDTIVADARRTGRNHAGVFSGMMQSLETAAFAIGAWGFSLILTLTGFVSSAGKGVAQNDGALMGIAIGFTVVPGVLLLLTLPLIRSYSRCDAAVIGNEVETDEPAYDAAVEPVGGVG